jgi:hypothetical protein
MTRRVWSLSVAAALLAGAMSPSWSQDGDEPKQTAPASFSSDVAFDVYAVKATGEEAQLVGTTPSDKPLQIPPCLLWYVEPRDPVDMQKVRQEVEARKIPGLRLREASDDDLAHLKGLTGLQTLYLGGTKVTDAGLVHLKGLTGLQTLDLWGTGVTDAGLAHLKGLTRLQSLNLEGTEVKDAGMEHL